MLRSGETKRRQKSLTVTIRSNSDTLKGKLIEYLQSHPFGANSVVEDTLLARFLPFLLDSKKKTSSDRKQVKQCLGKLSGYEKAIALEWGIDLAAIQGVTGSQRVVGVDVDLEDSNDKVKLDPEQAALDEKFRDDLAAMGL